MGKPLYCQGEPLSICQPQSSSQNRMPQTNKLSTSRFVMIILILVAIKLVITIVYQQRWSNIEANFYQTKITPNRWPWWGSNKFIWLKLLKWLQYMIIMIMMVYMIALKWFQYRKHRKQTAESTRNASYEHQPQNERYACSQWWW